MSGLLAAPAAPAVEQAVIGGGEAVAFWVVAPLVVLAALGLLLSKKAVHTALGLAAVMIGLAFLYVAQDAPFLGVVQVFVYTGAVMMLFLFVLMFVGVDSSDSLVETIRGQRAAALLAGFGLGLLLVAAVVRSAVPEPAGLAAANADSNPVGVARVLFGQYVFAFEATGGLLITAALGAVVLTHTERLGVRRTQAELARRRVQAGDRVTPLPSPGVFARHNAVDTPALLPDGTPSELSISRVLVARGQARQAGPVADDVPAVVRQLEDRSGHPGGSPHTRTGTVPGEITGHAGSTTSPQGRPEGAEEQR